MKADLKARRYHRVGTCNARECDIADVVFAAEGYAYMPEDPYDR